jgi:hypothetical protein
MTSKIISRAACLAELTSDPKSFSNCPDLHGGVPDLPGGSRPKERLASLDQASIEFVHANNPIPKVSGNRISRFRGVSCYSVVSTGSSPIFDHPSSQF